MPLCTKKPFTASSTSDASGLHSRGKTKTSEEEEMNMDMFSRMCRCIRHGNAAEFDLI